MDNTLVDNRNIVRGLSKVGLVVAGYVLAFAASAAIIWIYTAATSGPDRQTYGAMYEFGDSLLFLAVLGVASVPPTGLGLYFLRPYRAFWTALSYAASVTAVTGIAALIAFLLGRGVNPHAGVAIWLSLATLRILVTPLFALASLLFGIFASDRRARITFFICTAVEAAVFGGYLMTMLMSRFIRHY
jgi:hypothetical protein